MRVLDISAYYHDSLAARRALHHVNDHEPDTFSEKVRVTVKTAIQLAGTCRALLADDSQAFIETTVATRAGSHLAGAGGASRRSRNDRTAKTPEAPVGAEASVRCD